jgi:putative transposase
MTSGDQQTAKFPHPGRLPRLPREHYQGDAVVFWTITTFDRSSGLARESDQLNAMTFFRTQLEPKLKPTKLQPQSHDHVLRSEERRKNAFAKICYYITENPVRAALIDKPKTWPYTNALIPGYPNLNLFAPDHWNKFWKIYSTLKKPDAREITKPPSRL